MFKLLLTLPGRSFGKIAPIFLLVWMMLFCCGLQAQSNAAADIPVAEVSSQSSGNFKDIAGTWNSLFGPVTINHGPLAGNETVQISGFWLQEADKKGTFTGVYSVVSGEVTIDYQMPWDGNSGTAAWKLSDGGARLAGTFSQGSQVAACNLFRGGIAGKWDSNYGPVTFIHETLNGNKAIEITGSWLQDPEKKGTFAGQYDPVSGEIKIDYQMPWVGASGTACLALSADGSRMAGKFLQDGNSGVWSLWR